MKSEEWEEEMNGRLRGRGSEDVVRREVSGEMLSHSTQSYGEAYNAWCINTHALQLTASKTLYDGRTGPSGCLALAGYAGWSSGKVVEQLIEREILKI